MPELGNALEHTRLIKLIGPRQLGKTRRVRDRLARGHFVSLDEAATLAAIDTASYEHMRPLRDELGDMSLIISGAQRVDQSLTQRHCKAENRLVQDDAS